MLPDKTMEEVEQYFEELNTKPYSKFHKMRMYSMLREESERIEKENILRDNLKDYYIVHEIFNLNNEYQIVKTTSKSNRKEYLYHLFYNYKPIRECTYTFDQAILMLVAYKYSHNTEAAIYMGKLINLKDEPEKVEE